MPSTSPPLEPVPVLTGADAVAAARAYAEQVRPAAGERDAAQTSPTAELAALARTGLLTLTVPAEHGGPGASYETLARTTAAIAAADASIAQITQGHYWALQILLEEGSAEQLAFFLPRVLAGLRFGNAVSERNTAHVGEMRTRLVPSDDGRFRLDGTKFYSTGSLDADWIQVMALDDEEREVAAYVPRHADGVEVVDDWQALGQRSTASGTSTYTGVVVGPEHVVPHWRILARPTLFGTVGQLIHAAVDAGLAAGALEAVGGFVRERSRPHFEAARMGWERAAEEPFVIQRYGQLAARVHAAEELLARGGRLMDEAREAGIDVAGVARAAIAVGEAKAFAGDIALEVTTEVFALAGTRSVDPRHGLDRYWRDARTHTLHDPNRWKYYHAGNYALNGVFPPANGIH
jgi:SfnB family sulfur acquisition oxidoreductase